MGEENSRNIGAGITDHIRDCRKYDSEVVNILGEADQYPLLIAIPEIVRLMS